MAPKEYHDFLLNELDFCHDDGQIFNYCTSDGCWDFMEDGTSERKCTELLLYDSNLNARAIFPFDDTFKQRIVDFLREHDYGPAIRYHRQTLLRTLLD